MDAKRAQKLTRNSQKKVIKELEKNIEYVAKRGYYEYHKTSCLMTDEIIQYFIDKGFEVIDELGLTTISWKNIDI